MVRLEPNSRSLHAESESCSHCGYEETISAHIACECGRDHLLHLLYRQSG